METFDLSRLTDFDFEAVCKDLFELEFGVRLEIFTPGPDGGVDLGHLKGDDPALIVQGKPGQASRAAPVRTEVPRALVANEGFHIPSVSMLLKVPDRGLKPVDVILEVP